MKMKIENHVDRLIYRAQDNLSTYYKEVSSSKIYKEHGGNAPLVLLEPITGIELLITDVIYVNEEPVFVYDYAQEYKEMPKKSEYLPIQKFLVVTSVWHNFDFRIVYIKMAEALQTKEYIANFPPIFIGLS